MCSTDGLSITDTRCSSWVSQGWGPCDEGCQLIWCMVSGTSHPGRFFIIKSVHLARIGEGISWRCCWSRALGPDFLYPGPPSPAIATLTRHGDSVRVPHPIREVHVHPKKISLKRLVHREVQCQAASPCRWSVSDTPN